MKEKHDLENRIKRIDEQIAPQYYTAFDDRIALKTIASRNACI